MVTRRWDRRLTVRLSQTEWEPFEEARRAIHARRVVRGSPTKADTIGLLAATLCYRAGQGPALTPARLGSLTSFRGANRPVPIQGVLRDACAVAPPSFAALGPEFLPPPAVPSR